MSQAGSNNNSSITPVIPPEVATSYVTNNGTAIPSANVLQIVAIDVTDDNQNGIQVEGGLVQTGASNKVEVQLTNRITGTGTTTDDTTLVPLFSFDLGATPGTYLFQHNVLAYNVTDSTSLGYVIYKVVRTDGTAGVPISSQPGIQGDEDDMVNALVQGAVLGNTVAIRVRGLLDKTIHWYTKTTYDFIS